MKEKQLNIMDDVEFEPYFTPCTRSATVDTVKIDHRGLTTAPIHCIEAGIRLCPPRNLLRSNATFKEVAAEYLHQDPDGPRAFSVSKIDKK
jgi:hypothetical protein